MIAAPPKNVLSSARAALAAPVEFEAFLTKLGPRDRINAGRHNEACDPNHVKLWRRLCCSLMTLAPHSVKMTGLERLQFYAADGRYRVQLFAMEDLRQTDITIYCADIIEQALAAKVLKRPTRAGSEPNVYQLNNAIDTLIIDRLDRSTPPNPDEFIKHMLGWNRKALRLTLPLAANAAQIEAVELCCALSAQVPPK